MGLLKFSLASVTEQLQEVKQRLQEKFCSLLKCSKQGRVENCVVYYGFMYYLSCAIISGGSLKKEISVITFWRKK